MAYVFYDTETSGLRKRYDQILQFAAITTDEKFEETSRFDVEMRLSPYVVPSPKALHINQTSPAQCYDPTRLSQFEGLRSVQNFIIGNSPSIFAGWNSMSFDEEVLRHGFYRQLLEPYATSRRKNGRMDVMRVARAVHAIRPGLFNVPSDEGRPTFRLSDLCMANGFIPRNAHEGLSDVEAVIFVAGMLKKRAPQIWSAFVQTAKKASAMDVLKAGGPCVIVTGWGDATRYFLGVEIGRHPNIKGYSYVADLTAPLEEFGTLLPSNHGPWFDRDPQPVYKIRCNASPLIVPIDDLEEFDDEADILHEKAELVLKNAALCGSITNAFYTHSEQTYHPKYVEDMLYHGSFPTNTAEQQRENFLTSDWRTRAAIARSMSDGRHRKFGMRTVAEHSPDVLSNAEVDQYRSFIAKRTANAEDNAPPWLTIEAAINELNNLREEFGSAVDPLMNEKFFNSLEMSKSGLTALGSSS